MLLLMFGRGNVVSQPLQNGGYRLGDPAPAELDDLAILVLDLVIWKVRIEFRTRPDHRLSPTRLS